jgi:tetratricopeptide (TPR) repeat protein
MKTTPLRLALVLATLLTAAGTAPADTIYLLDGTSVDDVDIDQETIKRISYKDGTRSKTVKTTDVLRVTYAKKSQLVDRADTAATDGQIPDAISDLEMFIDGQLSGGRERYKWELAYAMFRLVEIKGVAGDAEGLIAAADKLIATKPDSRYVPEAYLAKAEAQHLTGKGALAKKTLAEFKAMINSRGLSARWSMEEKLYSTLYDPSLKGNKLRKELSRVSAQAGAEFPQVKNSAEVAIGESLLAEKKYDDAEKVFNRVIRNPKASPRTLAGAYTGYGDCIFRKGMAAAPGEKRDKLLSEAKMAYMRVVVVYKDQNTYVPKAMFWAGRVFDESQEEADKEAAQKLYNKVIRLYPGTKWEQEARGFKKR